MEDDKKKSFGSKVAAVFKTLGRWCARMFMGASKTISEENSKDAMEVEKLESPGKMAVKVFFRRKLAVGALVVLIALFLLVFIGPAIWPIDLNYTDSAQANIGPTMSMLSVPSGLKGQIESIDSFGSFTVGVGKDHTLYYWGNKINNLLGIKYTDFPDEIQPGKVYMAAAGRDHLVAVVMDSETEGHLVFWGNSNRGQFGKNLGSNSDDPILELPDEIRTGKLELSKISQLEATEQVSAIVYDGRVYFWGNTKSCLNMIRTQNAANAITDKNAVKVALSKFYAAVLYDDGTYLSYGEVSNNYFRGETGYSYLQGKDVDLVPELSSHKIVDLVASNNNFAFLLDNGDILIQGAARVEKEISPIPTEEKVISLASGTSHFAAVTDAGKVYLWGTSNNGECKLNGESASRVFLGSYQTYLVDENGALVKSSGLKGYLFGTDSMGRDTAKRIVHGGRMTMTIGAVAVIISSVIAIIVGCVSGYFGGWVDMLLMRITEIFSAIPFLPFAMLLSYVLTTRPISENMRIFIIMMILGVLSWTGLAHMIRGQVLAEREKEFVLAAKAMGVKERHIAFKHILPNVISVVLVSMTLDFAGCLLTESGLSYLGFGVQQPRPTWGNMLNGANNSIVIQNFWWQWVFPAIFLGIATICINIIGDTLRDVLDPKSTRDK